MDVNINITTLEIAGMSAVVKALHLPFGKECKSDTSAFAHINIDGDFETFTKTHLDPKDEQLLIRLIKAGDEHAKVVRGLIVWAEIEAPRYWWIEMDTYRIGAERLSSESTMHIQGKELKTEELIAMKEKLEEGTLQKRVEYFSYQTLRRIYFQRRHHRLPHWHKFCKWIESLPYASSWITIERGDN